MSRLGNLVSLLKRTCSGSFPSSQWPRPPSDSPLRKSESLQAGKLVSGTAYLLIALFTELVSSQLVLAQSSNLQIDPGNSDARVYLTSSTPDGASVNVGVARVEGRIAWNTTDPGSSLMEFAIYPANQGEPELYPPIQNSERSYQATENYVVLRFRSKSIVPVGESNFHVAGALSVTRVQRLADYDPSKGYSGPVYSPAVVHSTENEATFEFHAANARGTTAVGQVSDEWVAFAAVRGQDLPELMKAVALTMWPAFVEQERCIFPSSTGEDFSGPACTGKTIELQPPSNVLCQMRTLPGGPLVRVQCPGAPLQTTGGSVTAIKSKRAGSEQEDNVEFVADEVKFQLKLELNMREVVRAEHWDH